MLLLTGCANSPLGQSLQRTFAADPQLEASPTVTPTPTPTPSPSPTADLPADLPRYPNAELVGEPTTDADGVTVTRWRTTDGGDRVRQFYQEVFQSENWQVQSNTEPLIAQKDDLRVRVAIATGNTPTEFTLTYQTAADTTAASPTPTSTSAAPTEGSTQFSDVGQAPAELQSYINDLAQLGVLNVADASQFRPNQIITRREYARWLVATNNRLFRDNPAQQIRLAPSSAQPAFQDVRSTDPDFGAIQGLAEAGLIPSPLSGDSTTVTFRPDAPLTRENLIAWKVPLDIRQSLPTASIDAVKQTWGFQDVSRIDPGALRAVLADFQNGDQSNIRRAFGYTKLFQPKRTVSRAEAAAVLWYFGSQGEGVSAKDAATQPEPASTGQ
ncbi:S-layer homology domain-containing protein [Microcoleus sp. FACHB-1515]|uniref:S-layer homology domain-containing protein n=1 Tax=Cyanophyceae TaxID=3028117 RepID=UPI001F554EF1|nr:S-layer homology domain-containing protein [Microcoleus sp. FACHB-1515]